MSSSHYFVELKAGKQPAEGRHWDPVWQYYRDLRCAFRRSLGVEATKRTPEASRVPRQQYQKSKTKSNGHQWNLLGASNNIHLVHLWGTLGVQPSHFPNWTAKEVSRLRLRSAQLVRKNARCISNSFWYWSKHAQTWLAPRLLTEKRRCCFSSAKYSPCISVQLKSEIRSRNKVKLHYYNGPIFLVNAKVRSNYVWGHRQIQVITIRYAVGLSWKWAQCK